MSHCQLCIYAHSKFTILHREYLSSREVPTRALISSDILLSKCWSIPQVQHGFKQNKTCPSIQTSSLGKGFPVRIVTKKKTRLGPTNITWPTDERDVTKSGFLTFSFPSFYLSRLAIRIRNPQAMKMSFTFSDTISLHQDTCMYVKKSFLHA